MADHPGKRLGNYRLLRLLGEGSFAQVYLAEHIYLRRLAAIKVLQVRLHNVARADFFTEAQTIAQLEHRHIVRVLECGIDEENEQPFLVMSYASGGSMRQRYPHGTRLPQGELVRYIEQVAGALQYAHNRRLIHRDVKPENILLGAHGEALLSDFGLVLIVQSSSMQTTKEMAGTISYMAPEQIRGKPRPASDQYALGVVAYEWVSGGCPFTGTLIEIASQHLMTPPPPLYGRVTGVSPQVEQVILKALAKDPEDRYSSVQQFASALAQVCAGQFDSRPDHLSSFSRQPDLSSHSTVFIEPSRSLAQPAPEKVIADQERARSSDPAGILIPPARSGSPATPVAFPTGSYRDTGPDPISSPSSSAPGQSVSPFVTTESGRASRVTPYMPIVQSRRRPYPLHQLTRRRAIPLLGVFLLLLSVLVPSLLLSGIGQALGLGRSTPSARLSTVGTPASPTVNQSPAITPTATASATAPTATVAPNAIVVTPGGDSTPAQTSSNGVAQPTTVPTEKPAPIMTVIPTQPATPTVPAVLPTPIQLSPPDGAVLTSHPRITTLTWQPVAGAVSYQVLIVYYPPLSPAYQGQFSCASAVGGETLDGKPVTGITGTQYTFEFVGDQPGCWQVWAVDASGKTGQRSQIRVFFYRTDPATSAA